MPHVMPLAESRARAEKVAYLRAVVQMSWSRIRDECGFTSIGAVQQAYKAHRRRYPPPSGEFVFAELLDRQQYRNQQGTLAMAKAQAAGDYSGVASLIRALETNDADLAKWFAIGSETTVNLRRLRRLARPRRQDRRGEPLALARGFIDALVVDPRLPHLYRTGGRGHFPLGVVSVADHQPMPVLVNLVPAGLDIGGDLGLQCRREHLPGAVAHDLIQKRCAERRDAVRVGIAAVANYLENGRTFPNQRANAGS